MAQDDVTLNIGANTDAAEKAFKNLEKSVLETGKDIQKVAKKSAGAWSTFKGVLGAQAVVGGLKAISRAAIGLGGSIIDAAVEVETMTTELTTMTGSAEKAKILLEDLKDFAATTPFQLQGIAQSAKQLLAFGFSIEEVKVNLKALGDVASGSGSQLSDVAQIFGQISSLGKLSGERLNQLQERAIPIGPAIAKTMGIAESSVRDFVSKGKVDFATFEKAFKSLSEEGGVFFNSMIDKSKTLSGLISTLKDNFSLLASDIGQELLPFFKELAKEMTTFIQENRKEIVEFVKNAVKGFGDLLLAAEKFYNFINSSKTEDRIKEINKEIKELELVATSGVKSVSNFGASIANIGEQEEAKGKLKELREELKELNKELQDAESGKGLVTRLGNVLAGAKEAGKGVAKGFKEGLKDGGVESVSFWEGMVKSFDDAQKTMAANAAKNWGEAIKKIAKNLGGALTSGSTATRSNLDEIKKIEKKMAIAKAHNELAEYDKLVDEKIQAEKELAKVQQEEAGKFFSSTAGAVADVFIPGAGAFVETLLSLAQDPEAFRAFIDGFVSALPEIINVIVDNIPFIIETIIAHLPEIIQALAVGMVKVAAALARAVLAAVKEGFDEWLQAIGNMVGNVINAGGEFLRSIGKSAQLFINDLLGFVPRLIETVGNGIADAIKDALPEFSVGGGGGVLGSIGEGVSGAVKGVGKIFGFADGIASVPQGFPSDNFSAILTSGEEVVSVDDKASIKRELSLLAQTVASSQGGSQTINVQLTLDGNVLAEQILQLDRDNARTQVA